MGNRRAGLLSPALIVSATGLPGNCRGLLGVDLDRPGALALELWQGDGEHAALVLRSRLLGVDAGGKLDRAAEGAVRELAVQVALALILLLVLSLSLDRQQILVDGDLDLVRVDAGESGLGHHRVVGLGEIDRKCVTALVPYRRGPDLIEHPVHGAAHGSHLAEGMPSNKCSHSCTSSSLLELVNWLLHVHVNRHNSPYQES